MKRVACQPPGAEIPGSDSLILLFSQNKVIKANLIKMTHGLKCMLQNLILFTVLGERTIITEAGTECF